MSNVYKSSNYNHVFKMNDDVWLAYNAYSGAFVEVENKNYDDFYRLLKNTQI